MRRLPLLLISVFLLTIAGCVIYFWVAAVTAPIQPQQVLPEKGPPTTVSFLPVAFIGAAVLGFLIWIWALIHMLTSRRIQGTDKIVWAIVIVFLNILGAILYFVLSPVVRLDPKSQHI